MKRYINADKLIETIEYQCETDASDEALKWCNWFKEVINAEYNRQQKKQKPSWLNYDNTHYYVIFLNPNVFD